MKNTEELRFEDNLEERIEKITVIDGFAIGASASPGLFYSIVKEMFKQKPEAILPRLKRMATPIAELIHIICQYRFAPTQEIAIPWDLLRDQTEIFFMPFGCMKRKTPFDV